MSPLTHSTSTYTQSASRPHLSLPPFLVCFPEGSWHRCVIYVILFAVSGICVSLSCCGSADMVTHDTHTETHTHTWDRRADGRERQVQDQKWTTTKKNNNFRPHVVPAGMSDSTLSLGMIRCRLSEVFFIPPTSHSFAFCFFFITSHDNFFLKKMFVTISTPFPPSLVFGGVSARRSSFPTLALRFLDSYFVSPPPAG